MHDPATPSYADHAWYGSAEVVENVRLARDTYRIRLRCPEIARRITPGQFLMLRLADCQDPLLGRPLALYDTVDGASSAHTGPPDTGLGDPGPSQPVDLDVVYLVVGKMTGKLAQCPPAATLAVWGPLGNGFAPQSVDHLVMVAGGIGQTPFLALGKETLGRRTYGAGDRRASRAGRVTLCYGARSSEYLAGIEQFAAAGMEVRISTDDGSAGHRGRVTELLAETIEAHRQQDSAKSLRVVACGPEPMLAAVASLTSRAGVHCQVSLETPMACGLGICFSCVAPIRDRQGGWDYRRTCVEGPVFDADEVVF